MKIAAGANASAEARCDFVIAQIDVRAATRTVCRASGVTDLVFSFALKTRDRPGPLPVPKAFDSAKASRRGRGRGLFLRPKDQASLGRVGSETAAALAAHRAFGRGILHLLEATLWTFHIDLGRGRLCEHESRRAIIYLNLKY